MTSSISSLDELASGLPTGFILIADDVARLEEAPPGRHRVIGAGQLLHAAVDRLP